MIEISRNELKNKLSRAQAIISGSQQESGILFEVANGSSTVKATDLITGLKQYIQLTASQNINFHLDKKTTEKFHDIVKEIGDETIKLLVEDEKLGVTAGKSKFMLSCGSADNYPQWPVSDESHTTISINSDDFIGCLQKVLPFVVSNKYDTKNCVLLEVSADRIRFVGTDGYRLAIIDSKIEADAEITETLKYLIPEKSAAEIVKFLHGKKEATVILGNLLVFREKDELIVRPLEGNTYPNYTKALQDDFSNYSKMFANRELLAKALRKVSTITETLNRAVKLTIQENLLTISASSSDGEAVDEIEVLYNSPEDGHNELEVGFNAGYLLDVLKVASADDPVFYFSTNKQAAYIEGGEGEMYVVMPMVISR